MRDNRHAYIDFAGSVRCSHHRRGSTRDGAGGRDGRFRQRQAEIIGYQECRGTCQDDRERTSSSSPAVQCRGHGRTGSPDLAPHRTGRRARRTGPRTASRLCAAFGRRTLRLRRRWIRRDRPRWLWLGAPWVWLREAWSPQRFAALPAKAGREHTWRPSGRTGVWTHRSHADGAWAVPHECRHRSGSGPRQRHDAACWSGCRLRRWAGTRRSGDGQADGTWSSDGVRPKHGRPGRTRHGRRSPLISGYAASAKRPAGASYVVPNRFEPCRDCSLTTTRAFWQQLDPSDCTDVEMKLCYFADRDRPAGLLRHAVDQGNAHLGFADRGLSRQRRRRGEHSSSLSAIATSRYPRRARLSLPASGSFRCPSSHMTR